jgi:hypothetical protein
VVAVIAPHLLAEESALDPQAGCTLGTNRDEVRRRFVHGMVPPCIGTDWPPSHGRSGTGVKTCLVLQSFHERGRFSSAGLGSGVELSETRAGLDAGECEEIIEEISRSKPWTVAGLRGSESARAARGAGW